MSTPAAKRALDFSGTPRASKRTRGNPQSYRLVRPEMKHLSTSIAHTSTSASNLFINEINSGSDVNDRIGVKCKIQHIEAIVSSQDPIRVDILHTNAVSGAPVHTFTGPVDRTKFNVLETYVFSPNDPSKKDAWKINYKLPYGLISKYNDGAGVNINKGKILVRITCNSTSAIVTGYFRVWYTDV